MAHASSYHQLSYAANLKTSAEKIFHQRHRLIILLPFPLFNSWFRHSVLPPSVLKNNLRG